MNEALARVPSGSLDSFLSNWEKRTQVADMLIKSGFLPQTYKTPQQVLAVMLTAHELNIPEMEALRSINVIAGKPTISPQLMLALARRSHELVDIRFERTADAISCTVTRKGQSPFATRFGVAEAKAQGLMSKENYQKQPFTMFQWRALAANLRVTFSDVISGLYTPEELGAEVSFSEEGDQLVVPHEVVPSDPSPNILTFPSTTVDTKTGEIFETKSAPVAVAPGVTAPSFDPQAETIGFGKYKGMRWAEIPSDYIAWLVNSASKPDVKAKAQATLDMQDAVEAQREANGEMAPAPMAFDDPIADASRKHKKAFEEMLAKCTAPAHLVELTRRVDEATKSGELTLSDSHAITQAIDKRGEQFNQEKK